MSDIHKLIIIWSGPAGHTAAIYAGRALLEPVMFEWWMAWWVAAWGQLTTTTDVENYPGFLEIQWPELMLKMREQSLHNGTTIHTKTVDSVECSADPAKDPHKVIVWGDTHLARTVIITTGATAKRLGLPGEEAYRQNGVSACAVCDWGLPIFRDKHLVVIWWWDSATEEAVYLTKFASKVTMLVRKEMRASKIMQERVKNNSKIEIMYHYEGKEILGDGQLMTGMKIWNNQTQEETEIQAWGLFYAIGHKPNTGFLWGQIETDDMWYIVTKNAETYMSTRTNQPWVYAAWDVQDKKYRQAITSAGTGCMAALEAEHWLTDQGLI